jgi:hypothetical protein
LGRRSGWFCGLIRLCPIHDSLLKGNFSFIGPTRENGFNCIDIV